MSNISLQVNGSDAPDAGYIAWTPVPLTVVNHSGVLDRPIKLTCQSAPGTITKVVFLKQLGDQPLDEIELTFPGTEATIFVAGKFQPNERHHGASEDSKDVKIKAAFADDGAVEGGSLDIMVRVRKNANKLSDKARTDFIAALAKLNGIKVDDDPAPGPGKGIYCTDFVEMHVAGASATEHGDSHFLPWHRLYLLDLERLLQEENPAVTLPYWRFDEAAPNVFHENFMGAMSEIPREITQPGGDFDQGGGNTPMASFAPSNPLSKWQIKNTRGIPRTARFDPKNGPANGLSNASGPFELPVRTQNATLALGGGANGNPDDADFGRRVFQGNGQSVQTGFSSMEGTPHGAAHVSFNGYVNFVPVAPQDPLFFLLHCNVDRLWALWQAIFDRDVSNQPKAYPYQSPGDSPDAWKIINAQQWPWEGGTSEPGNLNPPGTRKENFTDSPVLENFPGNIPRLANAIDPYAHHDPAHYVGFAYDDVPYQHGFGSFT